MGGMKRDDRGATLSPLPKVPTGIAGLDDITGGGLPKGRPTLICGGAGCGKTLLGLEFLVRGAVTHREPGVFVSFEETADELTRNVASLGFDLTRLARQRLIRVDHVRLDGANVADTGDYSLEGLFVRLAHAIRAVRAKRIVLDTMETLFTGLPRPSLLRGELQRLFRWLKDQGVTAVVTAERGEGTLTRQGLEEYVADCVVLLDHRVADQVSTRRLRIVKFRGAAHGTNEYPFVITPQGLSVLPITALGLEHPAPSERISSGVGRIDAMLGGHGYYRGSTVLISGTAGTGKSSLAATFVNDTCRRGETALYFAFEESRSQIVRNMRSIGLNLQRWGRNGRLHFMASRPTAFGLEMHLAKMYERIGAIRPSVVVMDPISNLTAVGTTADVQSALVRFIDHLKVNGVTTLLTSLTPGSGRGLEYTDVGISSLVDTWLLLRDVESSGERNRVLHVLKSRGMAHSNQVRELRLTDEGIRLEDVYVGTGEVLTGSARLAQEAREQADALRDKEALERKQQELAWRQRVLDSQIEALRAEREAQNRELSQLVSQSDQHEAIATQVRTDMANKRWRDRPRANRRTSMRPARPARPKQTSITTRKSRA